MDVRRWLSMNATWLCFFILIGLVNFSANAFELKSATALKPWSGDLNEMKERKLVRILVPYSKSIFFIDKGRQYGTAVELGQAFEEQLNRGKKKPTDMVRVAFVPTPREKLLSSLNEGFGDLAAGNLTVTPERLQTVEFSDPLLSGVKEIFVTNAAAPPVKTINDLSGKKVFVRSSSSYWTHLVALNKKLISDGLAPIDIRPIDENLEDEDLLEMVNAGLLPWCVVDDHVAKIWMQMFKNIKLRHDIVVADGGKISWAMRKNSPQLLAEFNRFVKLHRIGTTFGNIVGKKYFYSNKMLKKAYSNSELNKFKGLLSLFEKHGATYNFNDILLAAQGCQESQLDQSRRSPRGAVGIMQLLPTTAADKSVNIKGVDKSADRNIEAGAKYLRHLLETYIKEDGNDDLNRMLFALAAYNAGPGNLKKFRRKAETLGLDPNRWFGNVENGAAAIVGRETVQYVGNIYKYYIAYSLYLQQEEQNERAKKSLPNL